MTAVHGSKARLLANGYDLSHYMREASIAHSADTADATTWTNADGSQRTGKAYVPGMRDATLSGQAVLDQTEDELDPASVIGNALAGDVMLVHCHAQGVFGARCTIMQALGTGVEVTTPYSDVAAAGISVQSNEADSGVVLKSHADTISGTADGATFDAGAAGMPTADGGVGALQVADKGGGAGTLTVKIQDSDDGSTWADLITFTGVTVAHGFERIEVAGTVERYLRAIWTVSGGTWKAHVSFARR